MNTKKAKNVIGGGSMIVLAIDPGRDKCGVAILGPVGIIKQEVLPRTKYLDFVIRSVQEDKVDQIILGDGTGSAEFLKEIKASLPQLKIQVVNEKFSTEEARERYWQEHKPTGIKKILPRSMQLPPQPYDDYVAVILAERFMAGVD